ncbi:MAG: hypothetical protein Q4F95_13240 [Oscillospiraceae bacterium]|nr:hypothetical protein [Oscillospiraceae bacterium]
MNKINTFKGYTILGLLANISFVLFIIITMIYYSYYVKSNNIIKPVETAAYTIEVSGFILMLASVMGYIARLRDRLLLKIGICIYFVMEFAIMICDFNIIDAEDFYKPASKVLIIGHCIVSAVIVMLYMELETKKTCLQVCCAVSAVIMLLGSFSIVYKVRVYASVLVNAFSYILFYLLILMLYNRQKIEVDCHGDVARVYEDSSIFDDSNK